MNKGGVASLQESIYWSSLKGFHLRTWYNLPGMTQTIIFVLPKHREMDGLSFSEVANKVYFFLPDSNLVFN